MHENPAPVRILEQLTLRRTTGGSEAEPGISKSDYTERALWGDYILAFEGATSDTSTREVPWYIILSNRKWFCNLAEERK